MNHLSVTVYGNDSKRLYMLTPKVQHPVQRVSPEQTTHTTTLRQTTRQDIGFIATDLSLEAKYWKSYYYKANQMIMKRIPLILVILGLSGKALPQEPVSLPPCITQLEQSHPFFQEIIKTILL